jgi:hypothetical protein
MNERESKIHHGGHGGRRGKTIRYDFASLRVLCGEMINLVYTQVEIEPLPFSVAVLNGARVLV